METALQVRRLPVGAEVVPEGGVHFRVWAPRCRTVTVSFENPRRDHLEPRALDAEGNGYFSGVEPQAADGTLYSFRLDDRDFLYPDPASRFQPDGPEGPSCVIDPTRFAWTDSGWPGVKIEGQVIYELHVGTFTPDGTWEAAERELPELANLGVTLIEVMPVADFPGSFGWGYDGVNLFAPTRLYGPPDAFRRFVDRAHSAGLGVILDVVYNHVGPVGNYLHEFAEGYFSSQYRNEWTEAINFDGPASGHVREFYVANARHWIAEYHLDGLRFDATHTIHDASSVHVLAEIARAARKAALPRSIVLVAENERQDVRLVRPIEEGGYGLDALWNDDFHHSAMVALTGRAEAYCQDYRGNAQELISAAKWGFLYQGQRYTWQKQRRGTPTFGIPASAFINCLQNHDQTSNSAYGIRCHGLTSPGRFRAMTALLLLIPGTPMIFQGQEFAASTPFLYFADTSIELAKSVRKGRMSFLSQFRSLAAPEIRGYLRDPADPETFRLCILDPSERHRHRHVYALHRDLLALRRQDPVFSSQRSDRLHGAVLGDEAFVLRFFGEKGRARATAAVAGLPLPGEKGRQRAGDRNGRTPRSLAFPLPDRLLVVNLGRELHYDPAPEPLLAPPLGTLWNVLWSSENPRYGGSGTAPLDSDENWRIPGHAAVVLAPKPLSRGRNARVDR